MFHNVFMRFTSQSMREAIRKKEKDEFLKLEKKKSRDTEMAFFKTEKSTGTSLNLFLMKNSVSSERKNATEEIHGGSASARDRKVEFAEVSKVAT